MPQIQVAAVLSQTDDDVVEKTVAFASQVLNPRENNFNVTEKKFSIVFGVLWLFQS